MHVHWRPEAEETRVSKGHNVPNFDCIYFPFEQWPHLKVPHLTSQSDVTLNWQISALEEFKELNRFSDVGGICSCPPCENAIQLIHLLATSQALHNPTRSVGNNQRLYKGRHVAKAARDDERTRIICSRQRAIIPRSSHSRAQMHLT
jgi:hypothetical protein